MKKLISFALSVMTLLAFTSCKKSLDYVDPSPMTPQIIARIYPNVNQPVNAVLGASATFAVGDKVIVYVPYQIANDEISEADLIITDELGGFMQSQSLRMTTDPVADGLVVPAELEGMPFMFGAIDVDDSFANKNFQLSIEIRGTNSGYSTDKIEQAFTVLP